MDSTLGSTTFIPPYPDSYDRIDFIPGVGNVIYLDGKQYVQGDPLMADAILEHILKARKRLDILETLGKELR